MSRFSRFVLARAFAAAVLSASAHSAAQTPEPAPPAAATPLPMPVCPAVELHQLLGREVVFTDKEHGRALRGQDRGLCSLP